MHLVTMSLLIVLLAAFTVGCAAEAAYVEDPDAGTAVTAEEYDSSEDVVEEEVVEEAPLPIFGNGERTFTAVNSIDMTINRIQFKVPGSDEWAEDDALANVNIAFEEAFMLAPSFPLDESGNIAKVYDMRLVFMDGTEKVLANFPTSDFTGLEFVMEDEIAFLTFNHSRYHQAVSTKDIELARIAEEEARIEAERVAEEQRRAEEEARRAAAARQQRARNNANNNQQRQVPTNVVDPCIGEVELR